MKKRKIEKEQYYTSPKLARKCVEKLLSHASFDDFSFILEPSAGKGVFLDLLPDKTVAIDIDPKDSRVIQGDFFDWSVGDHDKALTIGNPPFGSRGSLAIKFIEKACSFSDVVAFILPRSFKKYTFINRIPRRFHLVDQFDCEDFELACSKSVNIKAVFQIWEKRSCEREIIHFPSSHPDFEMKHVHVSRTDPHTLEAIKKEYDFAIPQVGSKFSPKETSEVTSGSHWFIKGRVPKVREIFESTNYRFLEGMNTTISSLSKKDLVRAYDIGNRP